MANISLESAIRTCKVDTAYANKVQSDRFLNPSLMVCPIWNGVDTTGREVCVDSYYTKNAGCNSAEDRIMVENDVSRPMYMEYINLSAQGLNGAVYGNSMPYNEVGQTNAELRAVNNITGNFGKQFGANVYPGCNYYPYEEAKAQEVAAASPPAPAQMRAQMPHQAQMHHQAGMHMNQGHHQGHHQGLSKEHFQNLARNPVNNASSQAFAQNQQNLRQQQFLNQGFQGHNFRNNAGN